MLKPTTQKGLFVALILFTGSVSLAQKKYELKVKDAIELALINLTDVKNASLDVEIQQAQNREITGQALPQISGTASLSKYLILPQILFPDATSSAVYQILKNEGVSGTNGPITKVPQPTLQAVSFFQPWNTSAGAILSQLLFQPDVFVGLQARKTALNVSKANLEVIKERAKDSAYRRYYAILIAEKQAQFLKAGITRLQKLYHDDSIMFKNGFAEQLDLDKVQVQLTNLQTFYTILNSSISLAYAGLKYAIGISQKDTVILKEGLSTDEVKSHVLEDNFKYEDRKEILAFGYIRELQRLNVKRNKLSYLPTISTQLSYIVQGQGQKFVTDQSTVWLRNSLVGLNLSLPIFNGFQRKYKVEQAKLNLEKVDNTVDNLKQIIDLQQTASKESLKNALLSLDAQDRNVDLAESVYNTTKKKFESGLGSSFEVLQSDTDWQTAQSNYFTSLYNAIVAKISYQSALGKLP